MLRPSDPVGVLSDLSGEVVDAVLDEDESARALDDPFSSALRRYQAQGAPVDLSGWRRVVPAAGPADPATLTVLRRLNRDLLGGVSLAAERVETREEAAPPAEPMPANLRSITEAFREMPALELASDGAWRPTGATASADEAEVSAAHRRSHVPSLGSRYSSRPPHPTRDR